MSSFPVVFFHLKLYRRFASLPRYVTKVLVPFVNAFPNLFTGFLLFHTILVIGFYDKVKICCHSECKMKKGLECVVGVLLFDLVEYFVGQQ